MPDENLIQQAFNGDEEAWKKLVKNYYKFLCKELYTFQLEEESLRDVLQETWINVYRFREQYRGEGFSAWLKKIARHCALKYLKKKKPEKAWTEDHTEGEEEEKVKVTPDSKHLGEDWHHLAMDVEYVLKKLTPEKQQFYRLVIAGYTLEEISAKLKIPQGTLGHWRVEIQEHFKKFLN